MFRLTPLLVLLSLGCEPTSDAPATPQPPPEVPAPDVAPAVPEPPRLSETEIAAVLEPARAALDAAGLSPLPLTLNEPETDGPVYDQVVDLLLAHLRVTRVRIGVHTDPRGSSEYNERISRERAELIARSLIERGISCGRLEAVGYGESQPLEDAPMGAQRRVELSFVRVDQSAVDALNPDACGVMPPP